MIARQFSRIKLNTTPVADGQMADRLDGALRRAAAARHSDDGVAAAQRLRNDLRVALMEAEPSVLRHYLADVRQVPDIGPDGVDWSLEVPRSAVPRRAGG